MNRRHYTRFSFYAPAFLVKDGTSTFCELRDVSNNGLYVRARANCRPKEDASLSIYFLANKLTLSVTIPCKVSRCDPGGVGLTSRDVDVCSLINLENLSHAERMTSAKMMETFYRQVNDHLFD